MNTEETKKQEVIGVIEITADGYRGLDLLLDVARRQGTKQEAALALNWMSELERTITEYQKAKASQEAVPPDKE